MKRKPRPYIPVGYKSPETGSWISLAGAALVPSSFFVSGVAQFLPGTGLGGLCKQAFDKAAMTPAKGLVMLLCFSACVAAAGVMVRRNRQRRIDIDKPTRMVMPDKVQPTYISPLPPFKLHDAWKREQAINDSAGKVICIMDAKRARLDR